MMRAADIRAQLKKRYGPPTHAIFFEVADATGARHTGFADAIAQSLWPSHGLGMEGFEIKVSRSDWKRELVDPNKAEKFAQRCDRWWIVTSEGVIADAAEIPEGWGWMIATMEGITVRRHAAKIEPIPMDRTFLAALLRSAGKADDAAIDAICQERPIR